mgnify:CR=1 FL=1
MKYDQRRIDACVNACEGISTEQLERAGVGADYRTLFGEREALRTQVDELAAALKSWQQAAQCLGERIVITGPTGYYNMGAYEWLRWCTDQVISERDTLRTQRDKLRTQRDKLREVLENLLRPIEKGWKVDDMDDRISEARAALEKVRG